MKTVQKIIDLFGGLANVPPLELRVEGFMPVYIENVGTGLNCGPAVVL